MNRTELPGGGGGWAEPTGDKVQRSRAERLFLRPLNAVFMIVHL